MRVADPATLVDVVAQPGDTTVSPPSTSPHCIDNHDTALLLDGVGDLMARNDRGRNIAIALEEAVDPQHVRAATAASQRHPQPLA
ncbi:hypothetical protein A9Z06_12920 [Rhizobium sp. YK2]|nr:hypothetical protein A9Z06_12920 [Rhizobium sp. YK2]